MKRREFLILVGGTAALPLSVRAQQSPLRPLIGGLSPLSAQGASRNDAAFRLALRDRGYVEGRNMTLALRYGDSVPERMVPLARELIGLNPDVIVTGAHSGALAAYGATRTIPTVVITPEDPVASGLAQSIARPGGNITGTWSVGDDALIGKRFDFLKLAVPGLARVAAIVNPDDPTDVGKISRLGPAARASGVAFQIIEFRDKSRLESLVSEIARANVHGLFVSQGPLLFSIRAEFAAMAMRLKLPAVYGFREFADAGGLMSYGPNPLTSGDSRPDWWTRFSGAKRRAICRSSYPPATS
jgi:putative ABC transport system substrate-binding protein